MAVYKDTTGLPIRALTKIVLTGATFVGFLVRKASGTTVLWTGEIDPDNAKKIKYVTIAGDLNETGRFTLQPLVTFPGGFDGPGDPFYIVVKDRIEIT